MLSVESLKVEALFSRIAQENTVPPISPEVGVSEDRPKMKPEDRAVEIIEKKREFQSDREKQVYDVIQDLRKTIVEMSNSIYQMKLTDSQVAEISEKCLTTLSDYVGDVTTERVKQIAQDLLLVEAKLKGAGK